MDGGGELGVSLCVLAARLKPGLKRKGPGYSLQVLARTSLWAFHCYPSRKSFAHDPRFKSWAMGERFDNSITQLDINKKGCCNAQQPFLFSFSG